MRKISTAIVALATLALAAPASAGQIIFSGDDGYLDFGEAKAFTDGTVSVSVTAWSIGNDDVIGKATLGQWDPGIGVLHAPIEKSWYGLTYYKNDDSHTVDNSEQRDFLLFEFDQEVSLTEAYLNTGWGFNDTDATIGYGNFTTAPSLDGASFATLNDFNLFASNSSGNGSQTHEFNSGPDYLSGNFWLIGASFDSPDEYNYRGRLKNYVDGFKLESLTYTTPPPAVPEPATWLMMILGFGLVGGVMRRDKRKVEAALA